MKLIQFQRLRERLPEDTFLMSFEEIWRIKGKIPKGKFFHISAEELKKIRGKIPRDEINVSARKLREITNQVPQDEIHIIIRGHAFRHVINITIENAVPQGEFQVTFERKESNSL